MISGIGTDIVETDRIEKAIRKERGFRELVFSENEITYCESQAHKYQHYAARFAAKEAFFKALGTGWKNGTSFHEVELTHTETGKPEINLLGETAVTVGKIKSHVSVSHLKSMATAVVVIEI